MAITYKLELNSKPKIDGTHGILLRITENRKHKRISTEIFIKPEDFNKRADYGKWIRKSNIKHKSLNASLEKFIDKHKQAKSEIENSKQQPTARSIINAVKHRNTISFTAYYKEKLEYYKATTSPSYYWHLQSKFNNLQTFQKDILFAEIDVAFLNKYEAYMKGDKKLSDNSVTSNLRAIRTILYNAYAEDVYEGKNPFRHKTLPEIKGNAQRLTIEEIRKIESLDLKENTMIWHTRNCFLLSFYCAGKRVRDMIQLKWKEIQGDKLQHTINKNGDFQGLTIIPEAQRILDAYAWNKQPEGYVLPLLDNSMQKEKMDRHIYDKLIESKTTILNAHLKTIAKKAGIEKRLTMHVSRHSYSDMLRKSKASIYDIKNLLGQSDIKVTERYLNRLDIDAGDEVHVKVMGEINK